MNKQLLCLLVLVLMASFSFAAGEGGWRTYPSVGSERCNGFPILSTKDRMYFLNDLGIEKGHIASNSTAQWSWYVTFEAKGNMTMSASDKYLYLMGGYQSWGPNSWRLDDIYVFTLNAESTGQQVRTGKLSVAKDKFESLVIKDKLYVFGGNGAWMNYYSTVEYTDSDPNSASFGTWSTAPSMKLIQGPVFSAFTVGNKVVCFGVRVDLETTERPLYTEAADIHEDGTLGPWSVIGGPFKTDYPVGAVFRPDSTLFVLCEKVDDMNKCYIMDFSHGVQTGLQFKQVTPLSPGELFVGGNDVGLGCHDRFVFLVQNNNCIYDPLLTSAPLFEESNSDSNLYE